MGSQMFPKVSKFNHLLWNLWWRKLNFLNSNLKSSRPIGIPIRKLIDLQRFFFSLLSLLFRAIEIWRQYVIVSRVSSWVVFSLFTWLVYFLSMLGSDWFIFSMLGSDWFIFSMLGSDWFVFSSSFWLVYY